MHRNQLGLVVELMVVANLSLMMKFRQDGFLVEIKVTELSLQQVEYRRLIDVC